MNSRDSFFTDETPRSSAARLVTGVVVGLAAIALLTGLVRAGLESRATREPEAEWVETRAHVDPKVAAGDALADLEAPTSGTSNGLSPADETPRLAIVFDDLGYSMTGLARELLDLPVPMTFAVLPGLAHSADFARAARERGHDVILHLPMEPLDSARHDPGRDALLVGLDPEENRRRVRRALDGLPFYAGVSNHMGSRYTADSAAMDLVFGELRQRRGVFYLDSRTTRHSVAAARAERSGVAAISNDLFLDSTDPGAPSPAVQVERLGRLARRRGRAVAIGHVRRETVAAVKRAIAGWRADGIRPVPLSELMENPARPTGGTESRTLAAGNGIREPGG